MHTVDFCKTTVDAVCRHTGVKASTADQALCDVFCSVAGALQDQPGAVQDQEKGLLHAAQRSTSLTS